jgi:hypothetical protein
MNQRDSFGALAFGPRPQSEGRLFTISHARAQAPSVGKSHPIVMVVLGEHTRNAA